SMSRQMISAVVIVVLTVINVVTVKGSSIMAMVLTSLKVLALAAIVGLGVLLAKGSSTNFSTAPRQLSAWVAIAPVMYGILWTYDGWADVSAISGEVVEPQRLLPRILLAGTAATIALYVAVNA